MNLYFNLLNGASGSWAIYICYCLFNIWNIKNTATFRILFYLEYEWNECNIDVENETHYIYIYLFISLIAGKTFTVCVAKTRCHGDEGWYCRQHKRHHVPQDLYPATRECQVKTNHGPEKPRIWISINYTHRGYSMLCDIQFAPRIFFIP